MGHSSCRVIGQTAEQWGDVEQDLRYLNVSSTVTHTADACARHSPVDRLASTSAPRPLVGASAAFNAAMQALQRVAQTPATVLISGESSRGQGNVCAPVTSTSAVATTARSWRSIARPSRTT